MPLTAVNAMAAPATQPNVLRARLLCEQLGQSQLLAPILLQQFFMYWSVKNFANAKECAEQLQALAVRTSDEIPRFLSGWTAGWLSCMSANYIAARDYFEQALKLSDDTRRVLIKDFNTAVGFVGCTIFLGWSLWMLGYPEQARKRRAFLLDLLNEPPDAFARGAGIVGELFMSDFMRDNRRMLEAAESLIALGRTNGMSAYLLKLDR